MTARPSRRALLGALATAGVGAPLATACASRAQSPAPRAARRRRGKKVNLTFWSWVPLQPSVDLWNEQHPDIQVTVQTITGGGNGGYQKMLSSLRSGTPPDLAQIEYYQLPAFMLVDGLLDLSTYGFDEHRSSFVDWQLGHCTFDERVRAVPQASGPMGMFYRRDLFEEWGIEVPTTWQEYAAAARAVREADRSAYLTTFPPNNAAWLSGMAWQAGARWGGDDGGRWSVNLTDEHTLRTVDYWERLYRDRVILDEPVATNGFYARLAEGSIVTWLAAQWNDTLISGNAPKTAGKWAVTRLPQWEPGAKASANWGGSSTAILQGTQHPQEAIEFATWLNTNQESVNLLVEAGYGWPAATGVYDDSPLNQASDFYSGQRYNDVFVEADANIDNSWKYLPTHMGMETAVNDIVGEAVARRTPLRDALAKAERRVVGEMEVKGLPVRVT